MGPYDDTFPWNEGAIKSIAKFLSGIYDLKSHVSHDVKPDNNLLKSYNVLIKKVTSMVENLKMNTAVSEIMIFTTELKRAEKIPAEIWQGYIKIIAPFAPFLAEDLWQRVNNFTAWKKENCVHLQEWPSFDETLTFTSEITIPIQINGKVRSELLVQKGLNQDEIQKIVLKDSKIIRHLGEQTIKKVIYIPDKIVSIVV